MTTQAHLIIHGRVQGVWYRQSTKNEADRLGLTGWVRNLPDGCVEGCIEGDRAVIEKLINWCYQGPPSANVTSIDIVWREEVEIFTSFCVK